MQYVRNVRFPYLIYIAAFLIVLAIGGASLAFEIPVKKMLVEAVQTFKSKFYVGFLSNLTAITWAVGAYCSLCAWWLLKKIDGPRNWQRLFLMAGGLTTVLMLDDLFMFHERIFPKHLYLDRIFGREPNEKIPVACYGLFTLYFLFSNRRTLAETQWLHLAVALGLLAFSVTVDRGVGAHLVPHKDWQAYLEEGAKFLGVVGWSSYFTLHAGSVVLQALKREPATA